MSILPKLICKVKIIQIKIPTVDTKIHTEKQAYKNIPPKKNPEKEIQWGPKPTRY